MAIDITLTTSDASGGVKTSAIAAMDWRASATFQVGILCFVTGTVSYSIRHSDDKVNWKDNSNISEATTSLDTNYMFPVKYIELVQLSGSGSVVAQVLQTGPGR